MIRRYAVMILGFTVGVLSMHAQDLQTRHLLFRNGSAVSTLVAPNTGGPFSYTFPASNGTVLMSTNPSLGTAGVMYSVSGAQDTATQTRYLFNIRYNAAPTLGGATASIGALLHSGAYLDADATGLTVNAVAGATSTSRGLVASATGGATNYAIDIQNGSLKINSLNGVLLATSGVVTAVTALPSSITIPAGQVTGITQYAIPVGGATGLASLPTGTSGQILVSAGNAANPAWTNASTALGTSVVLYNTTTAQTSAIANGTAYLFDVSYAGAANTGAALGGVINSVPTGAANAAATGLTINALPTGTGIAQGIVVNTAAGADLVINEDAITRAGNFAINTGAANTLSTNGNFSTAGNATLGTTGSATGGSLFLNDNNAGTTFLGELRGPSAYTADRTYTLPDADGTFAIISGTFNSNAFVYSNASGSLSTTSSATNGQILIGSTGLAPVAGLPTGTRGIAITTGAGTLDIAMPTGATDAVLRYNGTNWVNSGTAFTVSSGGNVAASGDATLGTATSTTGGSLILHDNNAVSTFTGTLQGASVYTADRTYTLPDADGTFAVITGTLNNTAFLYTNGSGNVATTASATDGQLLIGNSAGNPTAATLTVERGLAIVNGNGSITLRMPAGTTTGATLRWNGTDWVTTGTTYGIDGSGNPTLGTGLQSSASTIAFNDGDNSTSYKVTVAAPASLSGDITITLPTTGGTLLTTGNGYVNGGNAFGANASIGLTDNFALDIKTNNAARLSIANNGAITVAGFAGAAGLTVGSNDRVIVADNTGKLAQLSFATMIGSNVVLYGPTSAQNTKVADGANYLFNVNYDGAATGNALGAVISSDATGGTNASATGLTVNAISTGTGVASGIIVNTGAGADLTINEDAITRSGNIAINTGAANTLSTNGNFSTAGNATLGTTGSATGGSLFFNDNNAGTTFLGELRGPAAYTADRTYTLPDADGTFAIISGTFNSNAFVYSNASGSLSTTSSATNGQILIGSTGLAPVAGLPTGTRGIAITTGAGTLDIAMPTGATDAVLRYNGTNWVNSGTAFTVSSGGNIAAEGDATLGTATSTTGGSLILHDNNAVSTFTGTLQGASVYTADRTYTLPDADGTFAVITGTLNNTAFLYTNGSGNVATTASATDGQLLIGNSAGNPTAATLTVERGLAIVNGNGSITLRMPAGTTTGATLRWNGTDWVTTGTTYGIDGSGNPTLGSGSQGTASSISFNDGNSGDAFKVTVIAPAVLTSDITITLPTTGGTLLTTGNGYANGGNAFGAAATIGLTDNFGLNILTNNVARIGIAAGGAITLSNLSGATTGSTLAANEGLVIASATGVLSKRSLTDIVGSKTVAGSADGQVAVWNNTTLQYEPVAAANLTIGTTGSITSASDGSFAGDLTVGSGGSAAGGALVFNDDNTGTSVTGSIVGAASFTATRTFTLPDASGTFALTSGALTGNSMLYSNSTGVVTSTAAATNGQILFGNTASNPTLGTITGTRGITTSYTGGNMVIGLPTSTASNSTLRYNGTNWVSTEATYTIDANGNPSIGSDANTSVSTIVFNDAVASNGFALTLAAPTTLTSSITITLPTTGGTLLTTGNGYVNGGNAFGAAATIGLTDNFGLNILTNNVSRIGIAAGGAITLSNLSGATTGSTLAANEGLVIASATGVLSKRSLTDIVGSKTVAGSADGQVAVWNNTTLQYEPVAAANLTIGTSGSITSAASGSFAGDLTVGSGGSAAGGALVFNDDNTGTSVTGSIVGAADFTATRTFTLPDASGTFALTSGALTGNSMLYSNSTGVVTSTAAATNGQILFGNTASNPTLGTITGTRGITTSYTGGNMVIGLPTSTASNSTLRYNGTNWVSTEATYTIDANGNPSIGSDANTSVSTIVFNDAVASNGFALTLAAPTTLTSSITITLPTTGGTLLTTGNGFVNGGNSFGAASTLGNNDNFGLDIKTNNVSRIGISAGGVITLSNLSGATTGSALAANEGLVIASSTGVLSKRSLTDIVGSKIVAGTANSQVPIWNNTTSQYEPVSATNYTLDASGNVLNGGTLQVNGATTLGNGDAGDLLTINTGGAANMTLSETGVSRAGNIAVNPGAGNTLSTDGNLTVAGTTTANGTVVLGSQSASGANADVAPTLTSAFLEVSITNTDGTANSVTLPAGTNGQVLYMRLSVTNTAGSSIVTLVNNNASVIETFAQGANYERVLHMIYVTNSSKWVVLSNVQP